MIRINKNDMMLFKYLFEEQYIHIEDLLNSNLMVHNYESHKRKRLSQLKKEGYIKYKGDPVSKKNYVFPTEKTKIVYSMKFDEFKENVKSRSNSFIKFFEPEEYKLKDDYCFNSLEHDRYLTQLRLKMEDLGVDYWERETMYYGKYKKNPDAIFEITGQTLALELENTYKDLYRYKKIFTKYYNLNKKENVFDRILYVTTKTDDFNRLSTIINEKYVEDIGHNDWKEIYRTAEFDDFIKNNRFLLYKPYIKEWNELSKSMKKIVEGKDLDD